jgi:hypothetical protein
MNIGKFYGFFQREEVKESTFLHDGCIFYLNFIFHSPKSNPNMSQDHGRAAIIASVPSYLGGYIAKAPEGEFISVLESQILTVQDFFNGLTEEQQLYRYAPGKWSPRQILGHLSDGERVFQYRALRFARKDATDLPGFEENDWVEASNAHDRSIPDLLSEFKSVRLATVSLARGLSPEMLWYRGTANGTEATVIGLLLANAGHVAHHMGVIAERYLGQEG